MSRPFNNAKYQALLKGLEISVIRKSELEVDNDFFRLDSEYHLHQYATAITQIRHYGAEQFGASAPTIIHPQEISRSYVEEGEWFFRAQNLRAMQIDERDIVFISFNDAHRLARNRITNGDIVMTRSGANRGDCAFFDSSMSATASSHTFIIRSKKWNHAFLVAFLNTKYGKTQIDKGVYGAAQPEVSPYYLRNIWIPTVSQELQNGIMSLFNEACSNKQDSLYHMLQAEQTLLDALGLAEWQPPEPLTYTCSSHTVLAAGRFDSQYFAPRVAQLLSRLGGDGRTIRDVAPPRTVKFKPGKISTFRYIEIGDVQSNGTVTDSELESDAAPSRATWLVKAGDVLTSTVRPNRRLSALVTTEQNGCVASSGFVVLKPVNITPEVLLIYLRLPVFCELMDLHTSASLYPAISADDLLSLPIPNISPQVSETITDLVRSAHTLRRNSQALLERARCAVELAIEEGEAAGLAALER